MDQKEFDEFLLKTMKENNPNLKIPKKSGSPKREPKDSKPKEDSGVIGFIDYSETKKKK